MDFYVTFNQMHLKLNCKDLFTPNESGSESKKMTKEHPKKIKENLHFCFRLCSMWMDLKAAFYKGSSGDRSKVVTVDMKG